MAKDAKGHGSDARGGAQGPVPKEFADRGVDEKGIPLRADGSRQENPDPDFGNDPDFEWPPQGGLSGVPAKYAGWASGAFGGSGNALASDKGPTVYRSQAPGLATRMNAAAAAGLAGNHPKSSTPPVHSAFEVRRGSNAPEEGPRTGGAREFGRSLRAGKRGAY